MSWVVVTHGRTLMLPMPNVQSVNIHVHSTCKSKFEVLMNLLVYFTGVVTVDITGGRDRIKVAS